MILCVDIKALKTSEEVQKDVVLEDLLNNHTKYYDDVKEALLDNFVPLDFSTSIRSIYSNLVVENSKFGGKRYYTNITDVQPFPHKGYDLIMFLSSIFTQLRNHSHSWLSSAPVLAPPLLPVVLLEGSSGLSPGPLLSLHWLRDVSSRLMTSKPHLCVNGSQIPFPTQSSLLVSSLNCLTAYLIPKLEPLTGTPD